MPLFNSYRLITLPLRHRPPRGPNSGEMEEVLRVSKEKWWEGAPIPYPELAGDRGFSRGSVSDDRDRPQLRPAQASWNQEAHGTAILMKMPLYKTLSELLSPLGWQLMLSFGRIFVLVRGSRVCVLPKSVAAHLSEVLSSIYGPPEAKSHLRLPTSKAIINPTSGGQRRTLIPN